MLDGGLVFAGFAALAEGGFAQARFFGGFALLIGFGFDELVAELASTRSLVLLEQVLEVENESIEFGKSSGDVNLDVHGLLKSAQQASTALRKGETLGSRGIEATIDSSNRSTTVGKDVDPHDDAKQDEEVDPCFRCGFGSTFHRHDSAPLPALEGAESHDEAQSGDREEVNDVACIDETTSEFLQVGIEAQYPKELTNRTGGEFPDGG